MKLKYDSADSLTKAVDVYNGMNQTELRMNTYKCYKSNYSPEVNYNRLMEIYREIK